MQSTRHALRRARQCAHELRPDGLSAADSHRQPRVVDRSLLIMEDWAHAVSFDPAEIDKERGVILEEWRLGPRRRRAHAGRRSCPVLLKDSRYAERLPIGKPDIIRSFPHDRLKTVLHRLVSARSHGSHRGRRFRSSRRRSADPIALRVDSGRRQSTTARQLSACPISPARATSSPPIPKRRRRRSSVSSIRCRRRDQTTISAYRQLTVERVFSRPAVGPVGEIAQKPDAPFLERTPTAGSLSRPRSDDAQCARRRWRRREGARGALHRSRSRRALWLHTDRDSDQLRLEATAGVRAARGVERRAHVGLARRRVHPQLHAAGADSRHRLRVRPGAALPAGDHACRHQRARARLGARSQPRGGRERAEESRASPSRTRRSSPR